MPAASKALKLSKSFQAPRSPSGNPVTPPDSPTLPSNTFELARQFIETVKLIQASQPTSDSKETALYAGPQAEGNAQPEDARARASKLEYKTVDEVYIPGDLQGVAMLNYRI